MSALKEALKTSAVGETQRREEGWVGRSFRLGPEFPGFAGHFPGYPLVPAFVQVLASIVVMEEATGTNLDISALDHAKFQRELKPGALVTVECRKSEDLPLLTFQARVTDAGGVAASFSVQCVEVKEEK